MLEIYQEVVRLLQEGSGGALATVVETEESTPGKLGFKMLVYPDGKTLGTVGGGILENRVIREAAEVIRHGQARLLTYDLDPHGDKPVGMLCGGKIRVFVEPLLAKPRLFIFGGGHVGRALTRVADLLGFRVTVIDDRPEMARPENLPGAAEVICRPFPEAARQLEIGVADYVVIMTYGHGYDQHVLEAILQRDPRPRYIGMIASKNKVREVFGLLEKKGISSDLLAQVHSPIGLKIGAQTPEEIAVSIAAELVAERRAGPISRLGNGPEGGAKPADA